MNCWGCCSFLLLLLLLSSNVATAAPAAAAAAAATNGDAVVSWRDLNVQLRSTGRDLLKINYPFSLSPGRLTGVLGPSGCGKSTLLNLLSGKLNASSGGRGRVLHVRSDVWPRLSGDEVAYIHQDEAFFSMLTVSETLKLAAALRLPHESAMARERAVQQSIQTMALVAVKHSRIGDALGKRGVSGGERKRLSVACELLSQPKLLIADEPTSGLDAFQALGVVTAIKTAVVERGMVGLATLHQPRSSIYSLLDDLIILVPGGRVAYHGSRKDVLTHFAKLGFPCPTATNPAEHLIDLVSINYASAESVAASEERIDQLVAAFSEISASAAWERTHTVPAVDSLPAKSTVQQQLQRRGRLAVLFAPLAAVGQSATRFALLLQRAMRQTLRDSGTNIVRIGVSAVLAHLLAALYGVQGRAITEESVGDRVTIIAQAAIQVSMLAMIKTLQLFNKERPVVSREMTGRQYGSLTYLLSKSVAELPMDALVASVFALVVHKEADMRCSLPSFVGTLSLLGCASSSLGLAVSALAPTADIALAFGPALMVVYVILGTVGPVRVAHTDKLPGYLGAIRQASPLRPACESLVVSELSRQWFTRPTRPLLGNILRPFATVRSVLSRALSNINSRKKEQRSIGPTVVRRSHRVSDGDRVLADLGLGGCVPQTGRARLARMLVVHSALALMGLFFHSD